MGKLGVCVCVVVVVVGGNLLSQDFCFVFKDPFLTSTKTMEHQGGRSECKPFHLPPPVHCQVWPHP